jgi:hypothetical protein
LLPACALAVLLFATPPLPAAEPAGFGPSRDVELALRVRRALGGDPMLGQLNICVTVRHNVAQLWGDVPSEGLARRAIDLAGRVAGVGEVRNELGVVPRDGVSEWPSPFPHGPPGGDLAGRSKQVPRKADLPDPPPQPAARRPLDEAVSLGRPVAIATAPAGRPRDTPAELLPPRPMPDRADLLAAVGALCRKEERFARVRPEVRGGAVYLGGTVATWQDVQDLTSRVRRLPGVTAVFLDNVQVAPAGAWR